MRLIDAHIHLDRYENGSREKLLHQLGNDVEAVITVSMDEASCADNLGLSLLYPGRVWPAFGYHPEQPLMDQEAENRLFAWIERHRDAAVAIGEVGLPYYLRKHAEARGEHFALTPYVDLLERFITLAVRLDLPIVLHAVYDDADIACDLLEKHGCRRAHFHWFKGSAETMLRMKKSGYFISLTPDVSYVEEIREIARSYPLELMMAETDGPWPHEGPYAGKMTEPLMIRDVIRELATIRGMPVDTVQAMLYRNTVTFYGL